MAGRTAVCWHCGKRYPRYTFVASGRPTRYCLGCRRNWGRQQHRIEAAEPPDAPVPVPPRDPGEHAMQVKRGTLIYRSGYPVTVRLDCTCGYVARLRPNESIRAAVEFHGGHLAPSEAKQRTSAS